VGQPRCREAAAHTGGHGGNLTRATDGSNWCDGAAGIWISRLGASRIIGVRDINYDLEAAINFVLHSPLVGVDDVCCANFGKLEFLFSAARVLRREDFLRCSMRGLGQLIEIRNRAGFKFRVGSAEMNPGFFTAVAGIGDHMLRFVFPNDLPSVFVHGLDFTCRRLSTVPKSHTLDVG
jgi:lantibiotic modifying enzyme